MVRRKKDQPPMPTWSFRCTKEFREETIRCAEIADESDSEYIRKAVEMRNAQMKKRESDIQWTIDKEKELDEKYGPVKPEISEEICKDIKKNIDKDIKKGKVEGVRTYFKKK
ncbi:MAG: hypothetical protein N3I35_06640 [Clostridia bacterium]|nr:hypothetical protein [Clostridia bacterium]